MHELVLVLSDFYVSQETPDRELPAGVTLPGLQQVARFGTRSKTPDGWRPWLSQWLTGAAGGAAATVAAAALPASVTSPAMSSAWLATPMHLIAGMTSVHVDRRSILHLDAADQQTIAADFQSLFHDSGFHLQPLDAGDFLMLGPELSPAGTEEPARAMGASMAQQAGTTPALRKLGAEIEMWLYDHPINDTRRRRGEQPVTALWLWGGGPIAASRGSPISSATPAGTNAVGANAGGTNVDGANVSGTAASTTAGAAEANSGRPVASTAMRAGAKAGGPNVGGTSASITANAAPGPSRAPSSGVDAPTSAPDIAFGRDSYLQGLWATRGGKVSALPQQLTDVFSYPQAARAVLVIEIGLMLQSNPKWSFFEAVVDIDRRFIAPAVEALNVGQYDRLFVLANDYELTLRTRDRFKFWRRTPPGLSGVQ